MKNQPERLLDVFREFDCQKIELTVSVRAEDKHEFPLKERLGACIRDTWIFIKGMAVLTFWCFFIPVGFLLLPTLPALAGCWSTNTMSSEVNGRKTMETRAEYGPWGSDLHVKRNTSRYEAYKADIGDMGGAEDRYARERIHAEERNRVWGNTPYGGFYGSCMGHYGQGYETYCDGRTREYERCLERLGPLPGARERELCLDQVMVHERRGTWGMPAPYPYHGGGYLHGY